MSYSIFYNSFRSNRSADLALDWMELLDRTVRRAGVRAVMFDFKHRSGHHQAFSDFLDRKSSTGSGLYRARLGYVIEAEAGGFLQRSTSRSGRGWRCLDDRPNDNPVAGDFLMQTMVPRGRLFRCDFRGEATKGSRPDVRVALGDETEALFDITSRGQEGHVLRKADGDWLKRPEVAFIAEVIYDENEIAESIFRQRG